MSNKKLINDENVRKKVFQFFFKIGNILKNIDEECYNVNGKNNRESLTRPQFTIMQIIKYSDGSLNLKDIATKNCISKGALSIMISKLEAYGYVRKYFDANKDKRAICIRLTAKGEKILNKKEIEISDMMNNRYGNCLSQDDIDFIKNSSERYIEILNKLEKGEKNE